MRSCVTAVPDRSWCAPEKSPGKERIRTDVRRTVEESGQVR